MGNSISINYLPQTLTNLAQTLYNSSSINYLAVGNVFQTKQPVCLSYYSWMNKFILKRWWDRVLIQQPDNSFDLKIVEPLEFIVTNISDDFTITAIITRNVNKIDQIRCYGASSNNFNQVRLTGLEIILYPVQLGFILPFINGRIDYTIPTKIKSELITLIH